MDLKLLEPLLYQWDALLHLLRLLTKDAQVLALNWLWGLLNLGLHKVELSACLLQDLQASDLLLVRGEWMAELVVLWRLLQLEEPTQAPDFVLKMVIVELLSEGRRLPGQRWYVFNQINRLLHVDLAIEREVRATLSVINGTAFREEWFSGILRRQLTGLGEVQVPFALRIGLHGYSNPFANRLPFGGWAHVLIENFIL